MFCRELKYYLYSNGNILTLSRYGASDVTPEDNFTYTYNGNKLVNLSGTYNGTTLNNANYRYDSNGNMTHDGRKGIDITYDINNMPQTISRNDTLKAAYTYLSDGTKMMVQDRADNTSSNGYLYLGSMVFKKTGTSYAFESTDFGGGRIININGTLTPYYYTTDHLGSVRAITDAGGNVVERNDYYQFGKSMTTGNTYPTMSVNRWKYNGKETQTTGEVNWLDYGARMYDEVIGRWTKPDPKEEKYYSFTSYCYTLNNPGNNIDTNGDSTILYATTLPGTIGEEITNPTHTFIAVKNAQGDIQRFAYGSDKNGISGTFGGKLGQQNYFQDKEVAEGTADKDVIKNKIIISPPEGMTGEQFDNKVIDVAKSFGNNRNIKYNILPIIQTQGNCNTSTTTILYKAGVPMSRIQQYKNEIKGTKTGFGEIRPWTASEQSEAVNKVKKEIDQLLQSLLSTLQKY